MLLKYWLAQGQKAKLFLIVIAILLFFGIFSYVKYQIANYKLIKTQKEQLIVYRDSLDTTKQLLNKSIAYGKKANRRAIINSNNINTKLKDDTQKINNTVISDYELYKFLAEYEKKARNQ